jgi:putative ABC transport system permease protein
VLYLTWLTGLLRRRTLVVAGVTVGIAVSVALVATMAGFFAVTRASMTRQAIADVAVDWQVQLAPEANPQQAITELASSPGYTKVAQVGFFDTPGFESTQGQTVQVTGAGKVLGLDPGYREAFPQEIRVLLGEGKVLLAQQTAANLHAEPGSTVSIKRPGLPAVDVTVEAIVDLPLADSLFQAVGAPVGAQPQAPPDNVLMMPLDQWHGLFDPATAVDPGSSRMQIHVSLVHDLPSDPSSAFTQVQGSARNYETRLAGSAVVGDNLGARLDAARSDAAYAQVLFLFLGLPGVVLAALLTIVVISSSAVRRRGEQALLRLRGASTSTVLRLASVEALFTGVMGSVIGLALGSLVVRATFSTWAFTNGAASTYVWYFAAASGGIALPLVMIVVPAWREARGTTVADARIIVKRQRSFIWEKLGIDIVLVAISLVVFWLTARNGYQIVLAPEGVPRISVSYSSFLAPLFLWIGAGLLVIRLTGPLLIRNGRLVGVLIKPLAGGLSSLVGAALSRQRIHLGAGLALIAVSIAFATSTAIFNSTYEAQSRVDAELTNGADVTVTGTTASGLGARLPDIARVNGVAAAEPLQHRFAYVGTDLQDLYGVHPDRIGQTARLSDAFFSGLTATEAMSALAATPDGLLVSAETVKDFQLQPGDLIRLRLLSAADHQYHVIPFHYVGIAREFPTAPKDSFLVANADYITAQTASDSVETVLIRTSGSPPAVAASVRDLLGPASGATVRDIGEAQQLVKSGLTAVSLQGLTRIELSFAVALASVGAALVLVLGIEERRRTLAIATAIGARPRQIGAFVWSEAGLMLVGGLAAGALLGWGVAQMLVKLLTGVFDPPPEHITVPWLYLALVFVATSASVLAAALMMTRIAGRSTLETIRRL